MTVPTSTEPVPPAATAPILIDAALSLSAAVDAMRFSAPVTHVYNPLDYAWNIHRRYLERFGAGRLPSIYSSINS